MHHGVTVSGRGVPSRVAVYHGDQGCTILARGDTAIHFTPVRVPRVPPSRPTAPWPAGEANALQMPPGVDVRALDAALDWAMSRSEHDTRALVVVYRGQIIGERYAVGWTGRTPQIGWSEGKTILGALVGILAGQGVIQVDEVAPIPEWHQRGDPRAVIRIRDLLHMSSGLDFLYAPVIGPAAFTRENKHLRVYSDGLDVFSLAIDINSVAPPGTRWSYQNSDPLALTRIMQDVVTARHEDNLTYPQRVLFDRIGVRSAVLETDAWGHFILNGFDYMSARDWARFGLLLLHDGVWNGKRVLPAGWVKFLTTPAPAAPRQIYGGLLWLNRSGELEGVPRDAYWSDGAMGQYTLIIPSRDVVLVRLGPDPGTPRPYLAETARRVLGALPRQ